jgi:NnrU protein
MSNLALAAIFMLVSHLGLSSSRLRERLAQRLGEQRFLTVYKLITLAAFAWLIVAYRAAPTRIVWIAPPAVKLAGLLVVLLAFVLVVAGVTTPNPTVVGAAQLFDRPGVVRGILRVTRNSFLWAWVCGVWPTSRRPAMWRVCSCSALSARWASSVRYCWTPRKRHGMARNGGNSPPRRRACRSWRSRSGASG